MEDASLRQLHSRGEIVFVTLESILVNILVLSKKPQNTKTSSWKE